MEKEISMPSGTKGKASWSAHKTKTCMTDEEANEFNQWIRGKGKILEKERVPMGNRIAHVFTYVEADNPQT